jgi:hypothetical protein
MLQLPQIITSRLCLTLLPQLGHRPLFIGGISIGSLDYSTSKRISMHLFLLVTTIAVSKLWPLRWRVWQSSIGANGKPISLIPQHLLTINWASS